mmetsp:Transcript_10554/g.29107  ORF Transcript_10554/g.29107 Transcript_10554/m.29107 type:complete len:210 (-) Transcript_10554:279-908(-)
MLTATLPHRCAEVPTHHNAHSILLYDTMQLLASTMNVKKKIESTLSSNTYSSPGSDRGPMARTEATRPQAYQTTTIRHLARLPKSDIVVRSSPGLVLGRWHISSQPVLLHPLPRRLLFTCIVTLHNSTIVAHDAPKRATNRGDGVETHVIDCDAVLVPTCMRQPTRKHAFSLRLVGWCGRIIMGMGRPVSNRTELGGQKIVTLSERQSE